MKNKALTMALIAGAGVAGYMMMKKKNPYMMNDVKNTMKKTASDMLSKIENMD